MLLVRDRRSAFPAGGITERGGSDRFLKSAAMEVTHYNVQVNAVTPDKIATEGVDELGTEDLRHMATSIPLRRLGSVDHIVNPSLFFASDEADFITGQTIIVDCG